MDPVLHSRPRRFSNNNYGFGTGSRVVYDGHMAFRIKICGVKTPEDAMHVADAGADAVGLNFYEKSKRYVDAPTAKRIVEHLPRDVKRVGVFVNASSESIRRIVEIVELDVVQLHGDEPPEFLSTLDGLRIIRAFRCKDDLAPIHSYLAACDHQPIAVLVDAYDPQAYGGTGKTLYWPDLANAKFAGDIPLILAGGLTPRNVAAAIEQARPFGVDTASGVEADSSVSKSRKLCLEFVKSAKSAFADVS